MSTQPEALRLAAELEACPSINYKTHAAELRWLHEECNDLARQLNESNERNGRLIAQRDTLLEALKQIAGEAQCVDNLMSDKDIARAAIKAVEEGK